MQFDNKTTCPNYFVVCWPVALFAFHSFQALFFSFINLCCIGPNSKLTVGAVHN